MSTQDLPNPGRIRLRFPWLAVLLQAGISTLYVFGRPAYAQSEPLSYVNRGADGTCCSSGDYPDNGHDGQWAPSDFVHQDSNQRINATAPGQTGILIDVSGGRGRSR